MNIDENGKIIEFGIDEIADEVKKNYNEKEKNAITAEKLVEDKNLPGTITYKPPASKISENIVVTVSEKLNVFAEAQEPEEVPQANIPQSEYTCIGNVYCNSPDLSGFNPEATYYVTYNNNYTEVIGDRIDKSEFPENWYDYENKRWANVVTVTGNDVTYWTWIPRYKYVVDSTNQKTTVRFVDNNNVCKMKQDNKDTNVDVSSWSLPDAFSFDSKKMNGYWVSKYNLQMSESTTRERLLIDNETQSTITINTKNAASSDNYYTIYVNGEKKYTDVTIPYTITGLKKNKKYDICVLNEITGQLVGRTTGVTTNNIVVDTSGFEPTHTYYVVYDENGTTETIAGRMDQMSEDELQRWCSDNHKLWYHYGKKIWANLVTVTGNNVTYWTYIPRYEYYVEPVNKTTITRYIPKSQIVAHSNYKIPDAFRFDGKELDGYWVSKYNLQTTSNTNIENVQYMLDGNTLTLTTSKPSGTYSIWVNGELNDSGQTLPYSINIQPGKKYDIMLQNETNGQIVGEVSEIKTDQIEIDLSGFDESCTKYVLYDNSFNETIGDNIQLQNGKPTNMPENWYDYSKKKWANIVTEKNGLKTYWTYIPRYEYYVEPVTKTTEVRFISVDKVTPDDNFKIPDAFTFDGKPLKGYWVSKYNLQGTIN